MFNSFEFSAHMGENPGKKWNFSIFPWIVVKVKKEWEIFKNLLTEQIFPIFLGVVNHIFDNLNTLSGNNIAYKWGLRHSIVPKEYRGNSLDGPNANKLLKLSSGLLEELPDNLKIFGIALNQLHQVVEDCFGRELSRTYLTSISTFEETYRRLPHSKDPEKQLSCTIKAHAIFKHVPWMIQKTGRALGIFSAQSFEAVHFDFLQTWKNYKVAISHENYGKQLKNAVVNYNSHHIGDL